MEVTKFGFCSGYGYTGNFRDYFQDQDLPYELAFLSNAPNIATIHNDGSFATLRPGRVLLTACTDDHKYAVWLDVQDTPDWICSLPEGVILDVGDSALRGLSNVQLNKGVKLATHWISRDPEIAFVTRNDDNPLICRVEAKRFGSTVVTASLYIEIPYYSYGKASTTSLPIPVSSPVTVWEPEESCFNTLSDIP